MCIRDSSSFVDFLKQAKKASKYAMHYWISKKAVNAALLRQTNMHRRCIIVPAWPIKELSIRKEVSDGTEQACNLFSSKIWFPN